MKKQNIEDIFSSMENFSSVPPPELWGQIEEKLDKPKKKKRAILWWSAAACLLLGLMLPSVLHFNSTSGIKTKHNGSAGNNNVVLDTKKDNVNSNTTIPIQENNINKVTVANSSNDTENNTSVKNNANPADRGQKNQETVVAQAGAETKTNSDGLNSKSNGKQNNLNPAGTEKTVASAKDNTVNSNKSNTLNSGLKNQVLSTDKKAVNQNVAEKTFNTANTNGFNSNLKSPALNTDKKASNQSVAEKAFNATNTNGFNSNLKNPVLSADKKAANKILAEKTFSAGKTNAFSSNTTNQLPNTVFENQLNSKNPGALASNGSNPFLNENANGNVRGLNEGTLKQKNETILPSKELTSNSKFTTVLSKQDSVQLAELQNLEKGIISPEGKKEREDKKMSKGEKWAVEVFAGVASSENYKNDKTFGNTNDSKQSSTYGVKTKYKINKKWAVGSGLKINELGQSVANVSYLSAKTSSFLVSSDYFNQNASALAAPITSNDSYAFVPLNTANALKQNGIQSSNIESGNLDQSLRYIEMPLEVSYSIFNRNKASINLNTGGFIGKLISNNVAIDGNYIGQNVNANDYVYGSTLSSTLQYRVYKKTNVFVEPAMNYYINPLNNQSFNQFQWGLNFGLNVSF